MISLDIVLQKGFFQSLNSILMALDYSLLKSNNIKRYGTDIGRIGPMLLANRYDDRTHFIYELLQNAEDALKKRVNSNGPRNVQFYLSKDGLKVSHYGKLFDEEDVHGICGIGESTKPDELTAIGKFGIGFKAVYAFTEQPEVHSGDEHFAIDSFVWPREVKSITSDSKETVFWFPFRPDDVSAYSDILTGLKKLGARTLLFLREIEVISWSTDDGQSGYYLRDKSKILEQNIRKVALIGQEKNLETIDEEWLIFSKEVETNDKVKAGFVEIAYALEKDKSNKNESIIPIKGSTLTVYFPTIVPTHLGFLVQGPYRTTPSRDNVPRKDSWNIHLVNQTANLLIETLQYLRDKKLLSTKTLQALPIDQTKFPVDSMFAKLYEIVKDALQKELLLPAYRNGYISGIQAKLGRTKEIRELLNPAQLSSLFGSSDVIDWLSGDITINQTPELRQYLMREIDVQEVDADTIIMKLTKEFLEKQSDEWISLFYSFLSLQPSLARLYNHTPLIRLEDGSHCIPSDNNGVRRVFLPSSHQSGFPTVKRSVCNDPQALKFLKSLDLKEPDPVDDVIQNILSKFVNSISIEFYNEALTKVISAYQTDSASQKNKLVEFLKKTPFVMCRNAKSSEIQCKLPSDLYFSTDKLTALFFEIEEIWLVDPDCEILKGELQRRLLEECGVRDYLRRIEWNSDLDWRQREELRRQKGAISSSREDLKDYDVIGLKKVALKITYLPPETIKSAALSLWNVLLDALREARENYFKGSYQWEYFPLK